MYYEGDIKPVVKRVRPYKTLLINLPPKSFGFWVIANTQVDACHDIDEKSQNEQHYVEAIAVESDENNFPSVKKIKRSVRYDITDKKGSPIEFIELTNKTGAGDSAQKTNKALENRIRELKKDWTHFQYVFPNKQRDREIDDFESNKVKRQAYDVEMQSEGKKGQLQKV